MAGGMLSDKSTDMDLDQPNPQQLSSPPATPEPSGKSLVSTTGTRKHAVTEARGVIEAPTAATQAPPSTKKRKRAAPKKPNADPEDRPHGLGKASTRAPRSNYDGKPDKKKVKTEAPVKDTAAQPERPTEEKAPWPDSEFRTPRLIEHAENLKTEQLHKLDDKSASKANGDENGTSSDEEKPRSPKDVKLDADLKTLLRGEKGKKVPYSHRWGQTPYPDFQCPPIEQYYLVNDLLSKLHGPKNAPAAIPPPSEGYSLCGETECVIDAMMRTLLSANTRGDSGSSRTIQKMIETFGTTKEGSEEACIDWDLVRRSPVERIESTIKGGGEQEKKAKAIKEILDMVKWRNDIRRHALSDPSFAAEHNIDNTSAIQLSAAICLSDPTALSLDYLRALPYHAAFDALLKYPQIALKTASCVMLYCFQQPSFAVDTHVQRITGWLGWRPKGDDENKTFRHLEGVIPDELKYSLHTLFVVHGKECVRCAEKTHKGSPGWEKGCVLEGLIEERVKKRDGKVKVDPKQRKMDGFVMRRVGKGEVKAEESQSSLEKSDTAMMEDRLAGEDEEA